MTRDFDDDCSRPDCEAPQNWCDAMAVAAFDSGLVLTNNESPSISAAIASAAERLAQWAEEPALAPNIERLMIEGCVAFDPPLIRAALADGAEIAISAALIHWPSAAADELKAVTRAQNLLAAGAKLGIAGSPSQAALDALDAAARLADPNGREGVSILVRPDADSAPALLADDSSPMVLMTRPLVASVRSRVRRSRRGRALSIPALPNSPSRLCATASIAPMAGGCARPPPRAWPARPMPTFSQH